ncbi:MAG TPA: hypothetical protein VK631_28970 [Solirubrobacteraceae bacterium]|nr:hypothetical protein [Solirubrobacteraceae bacterium]
MIGRAFGKPVLLASVAEYGPGHVRLDDDERPAMATALGLEPGASAARVNAAASRAGISIRQLRLCAEYGCMVDAFMALRARYTGGR